MTATGPSIFARDAPLYVESRTGHAARYPRSSWARWGLRLCIGALFSILAIWYDIASKHDWSATVNGATADRIAHLHLLADVTAIGQLYPPLTSLAAIVIPGGALGLAIAGSFVAGMLVQGVFQATARKGYGLIISAVVALAVATTPMFTFLVTTNFESAVGLTFFGIGMIDAVRFVTYANTQAGFRAGLFFAAAAMSDSTMVITAIVAAGAATLIVQSRSRARAANAFVIAFPTVALFGALAVLGIAFSAGPFAMIRGDLEWHPERVAGFFGLFAGASGWIFLAPMLVLVIASFALRYPRTAVAAVLLTAATLLAFFVGFTTAAAAGATYVLLLLLAVAIVPEPTGRVQKGGILAIVVVLWAIGWFAAADREVVWTWMQVLGGAR